MITVNPGAAFTAVLEQQDYLTSALIGQIGFTIEQNDGTVVTPRTTAGIAYIDGQFRIGAVAPNTPGEYVLVWDYPSPLVNEPNIIDAIQLLVQTGAVAAPELYYAQVPDLDSYMGNSVYLPDFQSKADLILQCQHDIDFWCGFGRPVDVNTGHKYWTWVNAVGMPGYMEPYQREGLKEAVCAQAEYRIEMGPEFFMQPPNLVTEGPDYTISGSRPRLAPKALYAMRRVKLLRIGARAVA